MRGFHDTMRHGEWGIGIFLSPYKRPCEYGRMRDVAGLMSQRCDYPSRMGDLGGYRALRIEIARVSCRNTQNLNFCHGVAHEFVLWTMSRKGQVTYYAALSKNEGDEGMVVVTYQGFTIWGVM